MIYWLDPDPTFWLRNSKSLLLRFYLNNVFRHQILNAEFCALIIIAVWCLTRWCLRVGSSCLYICGVSAKCFSRVLAVMIGFCAQENWIETLFSNKSSRSSAVLMRAAQRLLLADVKIVWTTLAAFHLHAYLALTQLSCLYDCTTATLMKWKSSFSRNCTWHPRCYISHVYLGKNT